MPSKNRKPKWRPPLTKDKIRQLCRELDARAQALGVDWALTGGALFVLCDVEDYQTADIDCVADDYLDLEIIPRYEEDGHSFASLGSYKVMGTLVDWMPEGKLGSRDLFQEALRHKYYDKAGIPCIPLSFAAAIRLWAGRPKDLAAVERLDKLGLVDVEYVKELVATYCKEPENGNEQKHA
jgi:hypothetical protein